MKHFHITLFCIAIFSLSPAWAGDSPYKGGMNYTAMSKSKTPVRNTAQGHLKMKTIERSALDEPEEEPLASKVWTKYKALAAGKTAEKPTETTVDPEKKIAKETPPPPQATGFAAILQKYQQNKAQQSQMRVIEVPRPNVPTKPEVTAP